MEMEHMTWITLEILLSSWHYVSNQKRILVSLPIESDRADLLQELKEWTQLYGEE